MGTQMLLVLLAIVLFSTVLLTTYDNIFTQREIVYNGMIMMQGQKIADSLFQRIECELIAGEDFTEIFNNYTSLNESKVIDNLTYDITINSALCDSLGDTSNPGSSYRRVDVRITYYPGGTDTLYIGTTNNPLSKVFADTGLWQQ